MGEMRKRPEEIKKDLAAWGTGVRIDIGCGEFVPPTPEYMLNGVRSSDVCRDALAYIQQLEVQVPKWISVEDRLPEKIATGCLVYADGWTQVADWTHDKYGNDWWFYVDGEYDPEITHWMPLPEPPKEDEYDCD